MSQTARRSSPFWHCVLWMSLFACQVAPALAGTPVFHERKFLEVSAGLSFDNTSHLSNAIDLGGAPSVAVNGLRGVWGVQGERFTGTFSPDFLDGVRVGVQYEIAGVRDLSVVTGPTDAPLYGRSSASGAIIIFSKVGSDSIDPSSGQRLARVQSPQHLRARGDSTEYAFATGSFEAVYFASNTSYTRIAGVGDPVPGSPGKNFTSFAQQIGLSDEHVYFNATAPSGSSSFGISGVYRGHRSSGALTTLLVNDPVTNPYGSFNGIDVEGDRLAIGADKGLLLTDPAAAAPIKNIVPAGTPYAPGRNISTIRSVDLSGEWTAFQSIVSGRFAAFVSDASGNVKKIADSDTPVPGGSGNFSAALQVGISDGKAAFIGFDGSFAPAGLFLWADDTLTRIAGPGDVKDGKTVRIVDFLPGAIDDNLLAYTAYFTDGSSAAYLVGVVPEPGEWLLLLAGLGVLIARAHSRKRSTVYL